ncbi:MAG: hypothetical protein JXA99_09820 [Candidatus Lokiarchaeota archaeon]|nr:hypothetical protein [Candidatus Lokiarchaeota archaeon]
MFGTNISIIKDLNQKIILHEITFKNRVHSNVVNDYIRELRFLNKDTVSFNNYNNIISDNKNVIDSLKKIHNSEDIILKEIKLDFKEHNQLLQRYIGEAISQQLRNNFEKLVITNKGREWFKAVDYNKTEKYGQLSLFKGFRFKIIFLKDQIGIIIDPKSKFYTELTLRDLYDRGEELYERYLEKICPLDCYQKFNPFATCKHANPEGFGVMFINNHFDNLKPSEANDLISHYSGRGCKNQTLGKRIDDRAPVIIHYYKGSNRPYFFPLELIRKVPKFEDAEDKTEDLSEEVIMKPDERYQRIKESMQYFESLSHPNFPIILEGLINKDSEYLISEKFEKSSYIIKKISTEENPFELIKKEKIFNKKQRIRLNIILPFQIPDFLHNINLFFSEFKKWYNCEIDFKFINIENRSIENLEEYKGDNAIYLILKEENNDEKDLISYLSKNQLKNHEMHLSTLTNQELYKKENIYAPIYHKVFSPFYFLEDNRDYKKGFGMAIQSYGNEKLCAILEYENKGNFIRGFYIRETNVDKFHDRIIEILSSLELKKNLLMINGFMHKKIQNYFNENLIKLIEVSENSLIRLFRFSYEQPSKSGVPSGFGIFFNNKWFLITYDSHQGTQRTIKLKNYNYSFEEFKVLAKICFRETKYHLGFSNNSMKLPFPIHFALKTLKKLKKIDIKDLEFKYPLYL